ncbi:3-(3-hydroxy-phenyl)propionate hydroxylase [Paucibacter oligotrophus]|uniref:3-(3-hydroxy-phenyl)propionate hydroxylase n=1 Tax=Roseateles oligotrophus TaxID=1769250 RepID=A0A840L7K2_9BURK|nr:FAD-dependent oxidoreductase [Roseateles oligotrophus]MBB4842198.1 3-(3-hydroxy-phenyl)propionate hydroxylase [Roseateles oligotrophus]
MQKTYCYPEFAYVQSAEQRDAEFRQHPLLIIGAGPVGLSMALDCASRGIATVVLDDNNSVSIGSRAVCYAKRTLEVWDRLGVAAPLVAQGVSWQLGKVFFKDELAYQFDLLPQAAQQMPAMINLQQYYLEEALVRAAQAHPLVDLRWKHKLLSLKQGEGMEGARLTVETPDGVFELGADWVIACDGANSDTRRMLGAEFSGQFFQDRFLIADVVMKADFPKSADPQVVASDAHPPRGRGPGLRRLGTEPERWFWFDPPFHPGQSVLLHKQCDNVWRIDFQLGWDADPVEEKKPERVIPRIQAMLGAEVEFELEWVSVYQFACRRIAQFRHGRVLFAGDAAHQVSPFGARGANTGVQDGDNLAWKLKAVMDGAAPERLLDSYHEERAYASDDNLRQSTRSTDFISPKSRASLRLRNAVLELARSEPFARPLVNSGRLSTPTPYLHSGLNTPDADVFSAGLPPGSPCVDAPVSVDGRADWLLHSLGQGFVLLSWGPGVDVSLGGIRAKLLRVGQDIIDSEGLLAQRYQARPGTVYLIRPDQYVAARWRSFAPAKIAAALGRALAFEETSA